MGGGKNSLKKKHKMVEKIKFFSVCGMLKSPVVAILLFCCKSEIFGA
jgi:hypothetical protein